MPKEGPRECELSIGRRGDISRPLILTPAHSLLPFCKCQNRTALPLCAVALGRAATSFSSSHSLTPSAASREMGDLGRKPSFALCSLCVPHTQPTPPFSTISTYVSRPARPSSPSFPFPPAPQLAPFLKSLPPMPSLPTPQDVQGVRPNPSMATLLSTGQRRCFDALPLANFSGTHKGSQRPRTSLLHTQ